VLILSSATTLVVLMVFTLATAETREARYFADAFRAELAMRAGMEEARSLLVELTGEDGFLVVATPNRVSRAIAIAADDRDRESGALNLDNDPDPSCITSYLFVSRWTGANSGNVLNHVPLFAGGLIQETAITGAPVWQRMPESTYPDANGRTYSDADGVIHASIDSSQLDPHADLTEIFEHAGRLPPGTAHTTWVEYANPEEANAGYRYTWWVEDLQGLPQPDVAGCAFGDDPAKGVSGLSPIPPAAEDRLAGTGDHFEDCLVLGCSNWDVRLGSRLPARDHADPVPLRRGFRFATHTAAGDPDAAIRIRQPLFNYPSPGLDVKALRITGQFSAAASLGARAMFLSREGTWRTATDNAPLGADPSLGTAWSLGLHPYAERGIIPHGLGYPRAGHYPANITRQTRQGVASLTAYLRENLPDDWEERKGGFPGDYLTALAANMVDYMDRDHEPTAASTLDGLASTILYRGIESMPAVTELYLRLRWIGIDGPDGGPWTLTIGVTPLVEFWNPVLPINPQIGPTRASPCAPFSGTIGFVYAHHSCFVANRYDLRAGDIIPQKFDDSATLAPGNPSAEEGTVILTRNLTLDPNQQKLVAFTEIRHQFTVPATGVPGDIGPTSAKIAGNLTRSGKGHPDHDFESTYIIVDDKGTILDMAGGGVVRDGGYTLLPGTTKYSGNQGNQTLYREPAINQLGTVIVNPGDPLVSPFIRGARQKDVSYAHATLGGRNFRHAMADGEVHKETNLEIWPDGGYNAPTWDGRSYENGPGTDMLFRRNRASLVKPVPGKRRQESEGASFLTEADWREHCFSLLDRPPGYDPFHPDSSRNRPSTEAESAYAINMTKAPFRVSNAGRFYSLAELGHIHDPIMWQTGGEPHSAWTRRQFNRWRAIAANAGPSTAQGGGNTLRIGRPEHPRFSDANRFNPQTSANPHSEYPAPSRNEAYRLLDIFTAGTPGTPTSITAGQYEPDVHLLPATPQQAETTALGAGGLFHAESLFRLIHGHLNINTMPSANHAMCLTSKPLTTDQGYGSPSFLERYPRVANLHHGDPAILARLYADRPYYCASQLAEVFSAQDLTTGAAIQHPEFDHATRFLDEGAPVMQQGAPATFPMQWEGKQATRVSYPAIRNQNLHWDASREQLSWGMPHEIPTHDRATPRHLPTGDSAAEESFARVFNLTNLSSRHFRIHVAGEYFRGRDRDDRPLPVSFSRRTFEVFLHPVRSHDGALQRVECRILSEQAG
jgi:hypothetical protein